MERFTRIKSGELGLSPSRIIKADDFSTAHDARAILEQRHGHDERGPLCLELRDVLGEQLELSGCIAGSL